MSLINEALKKAQRARQEGAAPEAAETGGAVARRAKPRSARSMLLIGVGAVALVVASMIGTAIWLTHGPDDPVAPAKAPVAVAPQPAELPAITPQVSVPMAETPTVTPIAVTLPPPTPTPAPGAVDPEPRTPEPTEPAPAATLAEATPAPAAVAPEPGADERVHQFVESVRVMGIRSSGNESKVLMNDRVYRVNDVVERTLGVKLIKVAPDSLTFTDAQGAVYVKNF